MDSIKKDQIETVVKDVEENPFGYSIGVIVVIAFLIIALGVGSNLVFVNEIKNALLEQRLDTFPDFIDIQVHSHIPDAKIFENWQSEEAKERFKDFYSQFASFPEIVALKILDTKGVVIWASNGKDVGNLHVLVNIDESLVDGVYIDNSGELGEEGLDDVIELYMPVLMNSGEVVGFVNLYFDKTFLISHLDYVKFLVLGMTFGVLIFITLTLYLSFYKRNQHIVKQAWIIKNYAMDLESMVSARTDALKSSEAEYQNLFGALPLCIKILDNEGKLISINDYGKREHFITEMTDEEVKNWNWLNTVDDSCKKELDTKLKHAMEGHLGHMEMKHAPGTSDGEYCALTLVPVFDEKGNVSKIIAVSSDINEMKSSEIALKESESKYRDLVDNALVGVYVSDFKGAIQYANVTLAKMFGFDSVKEMANVGASMRYKNPEDEKLFLEKLKHVEGVVGYELALINKSGEVLNVLISAKRSGSVFSGMIIDITDKNKAIEKAEEANDLRNKFIRIVSHQFRTPLNAVRWNLETLLSEGLGKISPEQKEFLRMTYDANIEVISRTNDLLIAMDIQEERVVFRKEEVLIENLWGTVMVQAKKMIDLKSIVFTYNSLAKRLPSIKMDSEKILLVLKKLMDNALVYTAEKGKVTAEFSETKDSIKFRILDSGIGIPADEKDRVFGFFYRATNATMMKADASGIGLAIAKYFIEKHGGTIGLESTEGSGTEVWFELPKKFDDPLISSGGL